MEAVSADGVMPPGATIPAFRLPVLGGGEEALPDGGASGSTILFFYKNSCPTCRLVVPFLQRLHEQVAPAGGRVFGISQDGETGAADFSREAGLTMPILVDGADWPVSRLFGLVTVPTIYLVDRAGKILTGFAGFNREELRSMAESLAAGVGAPPPVLYREAEAVPAFKPG